MAGALAKTPHAFATLVGWVRIVRGAMRLCISVFLIAQDTESSTLTLANANAIPNGLEGIATSVSIAIVNPNSVVTVVTFSSVSSEIQQMFTSKQPASKDFYTYIYLKKPNFRAV